MCCTRACNDRATFLRRVHRAGVRQVPGAAPGRGYTGRHHSLRTLASTFFSSQDHTFYAHFFFTPSPSLANQTTGARDLAPRRPVNILLFLIQAVSCRLSKCLFSAFSVPIPSLVVLNQRKLQESSRCMKYSTRTVFYNNTKCTTCVT